MIFVFTWTDKTRMLIQRECNIGFECKPRAFENDFGNEFGHDF